MSFIRPGVDRKDNSGPRKVLDIKPDHIKEALETFAAVKELKTEEEKQSHRQLMDLLTNLYVEAQTQEKLSLAQCYLLAVCLLHLPDKNIKVAGLVKGIDDLENMFGIIKNFFGTQKFFDGLKKQFQVDKSKIGAVLSFDDFQNRFKVLPKVKQRIPLAPSKIDLDDLDDNGRLKVKFTKEIDIEIRKRKAGQHFFGRVRKEDLVKVVGEKLPYAAEYYEDKDKKESFTGYLYKGEKHNKLLGKGAFGGIKILMKKPEPTDSTEDPNDLWYVVKLQPPNDTEFKIARDLGLAKFRVQRISPKIKEEIRGNQGSQRCSEDFLEASALQDEVIMPWIPGIEAFDLYEQHRHPVFWMKILINMCDPVLDVHKKGYLHRDIKLENFLVFGTQVRLVDMGLAEEYDQEGKVIGDPRGTRGYVHRKIFEQSQYDNETETYALAVVMALLAKLVTNESIDMMKKLNADVFALRGGFQVKQQDEVQESNGFPKDVLLAMRDKFKEILNPDRLKPPKDDKKQESGIKKLKDFLQVQFERVKRESPPVNTVVIDINEYVELARNEEMLRQKALKANTAVERVQWTEQADEYKKMRKRFITHAENSELVQFVCRGETRPSPKQYIAACRDFEKCQMINEFDLAVGQDVSKMPAILKENMEKDIRYQFHFVSYQKEFLRTNDFETVILELSRYGVANRR